MFKFRVFLIGIGSLLAVLGLIISLVAAVSGTAQAQPPLSPFDQTDDVIVPDKGFVPYIAPSLPAEKTALTDQMQPVSQLATGQAPSAYIPLPISTPIPILIPDRIVIPSIELDAPLVPATLRTIVYLDKIYPQWKVPNFFAAGWAPTSAPLGIIGNTVLFGHHNADGEVFAHLVDLQVNDLIVLYSGEMEFSYIVVLRMILQERNEPIDVRLQNARWILPSLDERLTLLTCWPYTSNTHRLIIVAIPIDGEYLKDYPLIPRFTPSGP